MIRSAPCTQTRPSTSRSNVYKFEAIVLRELEKNEAHLGSILDFDTT